MAEAPYLIALGFLEQNGRRALPLNGKSLPTAAAAAASDPGEDGRSLALELLLRMWQRSAEGPLQRAAGSDSLLLLVMPLAAMNEQLPKIKAAWIEGADTADTIEQLRALASRAWTAAFMKYEPVSFSPIP
ncbi:MAG: hypothetical protein AAFX65_07965 [Cyanobacteria bacterium J06638_7]